MAYSKRGYVALLDVLGFSERVMRGFDKLDAYISTVTDITETHFSLGTILFSDTVVLYTFDDTDSSFNAIITACSRLSHSLIVAEVPFRGALSYGEFLRSENADHGTVIAGRPIIDAHFYESRVQWIGMMLAPSVLEHRKELTVNGCSLASALSAGEGTTPAIEALLKLRIQPCASLPIQDGSGHVTQFEGFAIVPIGLRQTPTLPSIRESLDQARTKLERLKQLAPEARSQAKYQRTIEWLNAIHSNFVTTFAGSV